jgi:hypothetical protein
MDSYANPPANKAELLAWIEAEWQALHRAVQPLSEQQMTISDAGGWSIKDNLAHLAEWERYLVLHHMRGIEPGEVWDLEAGNGGNLDEDDVNHLLWQRNRAKTKSEVLSMLAESHKLVLAELERWRFEKLLKPRIENGPDERPVGLLVAGNTYLHYEEHRRTIETLLSQEAGGNHD